MPAKLALFADLSRTIARSRGRPPLYTAESIALLDRAYARVHLTADTGSHVLARHFLGQASDLLRRAGARDLAAEADRALRVSIGHPDVDHLLGAIDRRITDRNLRDAGIA